MTWNEINCLTSFDDMMQVTSGKDQEQYWEDREKPYSRNIHKLKDFSSPFPPSAHKGMLPIKEIGLQVTERFTDQVVDEGYNPSYGAKPLHRAIMRLLEDSLAEKMLAGEIKEGDSAIVDVDGEGNVIVLNGKTGTAGPSATALAA